MNDKDLISNIGTIASSGTQKFLKIYKTTKSNLIGQFGVGFYSAFMVSDKITIFSKKINDNKTYKWESNGVNEYSIEKINDKEIKYQGTRIILKIKENCLEFL